MPKKAPAPSPRAAVRLQAVIFLGADAMSMMVEERRGGEHRVLDVLSQPVELAQDVFGSGLISRDTMDRCVHVARGFLHLLEEYRPAGELQVRLLATNILLDIRNMDTLVNRVQIACGLRLQVMDDGEMTRLLYLHVQQVLAEHPELEKKRVVVQHIGPGNTRFIVLERGRITHYANYRIGAHRTAVRIGDASPLGTDNEATLIREHIRGTIEQISYDLDGALTDTPDALLVFGPDFRCCDPAASPGELLSPEQLAQRAGELARLRPERRAELYREDDATVAAMLPAMLIALAVARALEPGAVLCPAEPYAHEFLRHLMPAAGNDTALEDEVIHFSQLLAARYRVDRGHSNQIRKLCTALFDALQELHGLSRHDRLVLKVAAILHEIGTYISPKNHHRHGQYIILNSEIFGLSRRDVEVVGLLARYHRHGAPTMEDSSYTELELADRLRVQKLAALLRVAEAMERAHSHRISEFSVRRNNRRLELLVADVRDLTLENHALRDKGALFTDIFGYEPVLLPAEV